MCFPFSCLIIKRNYTETSLFMLKLCGKQYLSSCFVQSTALDVIKVLKISRHGLCFQNVRVTKWCVKCLLFNMAAFCPNRTQWMQGVGVLRMNGLVHSLPCCQLCSQCFLMHFSFTEFFSSRFWFFVVSVSLVKCSCSLILSLSHWTAFLRFLRSHFFMTDFECSIIQISLPWLWVHENCHFLCVTLVVHVIDVLVHLK